MDIEKITKQSAQITNDMCIFYTEMNIKNIISDIAFILQVIIIIQQVILSIILPKESSFFILATFPICVTIIGLVQIYTRQQIDKKMKELEENIDFNTTGRIKPSVFNTMIDGLDLKRKYHICRELDSEGYIKDWTLYRQDMETEEYFSDSNIPILNSKNNTIADLIIFAMENKE